jgi:hypothetical protein
MPLEYMRCFFCGLVSPRKDNMLPARFREWHQIEVLAQQGPTKWPRREATLVELKAIEEVVEAALERLHLEIRQKEEENDGEG